MHSQGRNCLDHIAGFCGSSSTMFDIYIYIYSIYILYKYICDDAMYIIYIYIFICVYI